MSYYFLVIICVPVCAQFEIKREFTSMNLLINYTHYLNKVNPIKDLILIRSHNIEMNNALLMEQFERQLHNQLQIPILKISNTPSDMNNRQRLVQLIGYKALAYIFLHRLDDKTRERVARHLLWDRHEISMIFIVDRMMDDVKKLRSFFHWCWDTNILNMILIYENYKSTLPIIYTYTPFPQLRLIRLNASDDYKTFIWNKVANVRKYLFKVEMFYDLPMISLDSDGNLIGLAGCLFAEFVRRINGTYKVWSLPVTKEINSVREQSVILKPSYNQMDIGVNPFTSIMEFANESETSYPIALTKICISVPMVREAPRRDFIFNVFNRQTQQFQRIMLILFTLLHIFLNRTQRPSGRSEVGLAIIYALNSALSQPMPMRERRTCANRLIIICLALYGLLFTNAYIGGLTSIISITIPGRQIHNLQDFLTSNLEILVLPYDRDVFFKTTLLPPVLRARVRTADIWTVVRHRASLNTTYAYIFTTEKWQIHDLLQKSLSIPRFRVVNQLCSPLMPQALALQYDSPFQEALTIFIMQSQQFGLDYKWLQTINEMRSFLRSIRDDTHQHPAPLDLQYFVVVFTLYAVCCIISIVTFLVEYFVLEKIKGVIQHSNFQTL